MNDRHPTIDIISQGWKRLKFPKSPDDDRKLFGNTPGVIPSNKLLKDLILVPQSDNVDSCYLGRYRNPSLQQEFDEKSQKLVQKYSNNIVYHLGLCRSGGKYPGKTNIFIHDFCDRNHICHGFVEYCFLLNNYCKSILRTVPYNRQKESSIIIDLDTTYGACVTNRHLYDVSLQDNYLSYEEYSERLKESVDLVRSRFSEFRMTEGFIKQFMKIVVLHRAVDRFNAAVVEDKKNAISKFRKYTDKKGTPIHLRRCWVCYKFTEGSSVTSRTCGDGQCAYVEKKWLEEQIFQENR
jgi:hypothetical protein